MLIRFRCDSDIIFSRGLHKNLVTVLYFSIINVLCGAGGDASFTLQANLLLFDEDDCLAKATSNGFLLCYLLSCYCNIVGGVYHTRVAVQS